MKIIFHAGCFAIGTISVSSGFLITTSSQSTAWGGIVTFSQQHPQNEISQHFEETTSFNKMIMIPSVGTGVESVDKVDTKNMMKVSRHVSKLARAGTSSLQQRLHSIIGIGSLAFGCVQYAHLMQHGYGYHLPLAYVVGVGSLHVLTPFMGLSRLDWKNKKEKIRNAMIWPVPFQNTWLVAAALSEWARGSDALFSMKNDAFIALNIFILLVTAWQFSVSYESGGVNEYEQKKSGIWFKSPTDNSAFTLFLYSAPIVVMCLQALYTNMFLGTAEQINFSDSHPEYSNFVSNMMMNTAFFNNVAVFESTLVKYGVLKSTQAAVMFITPEFGVFIMGIGTFLHADGGKAQSDLLDYFLSPWFG